MNETATTQSQGTFGRLFSDLFAAGSNVLAQVGQVKAQGYIQQLEAENLAKIQRTLQVNSSSPSNDPADAAKAAAENTTNLFGFVTVPKAMAPFYLGAFALVAVLALIVIFRLVRK
jgi:hypothetical protein